jgi:hypothetical protein
MKLFHCKHLLCLRKERLHIPTLFFYFLFSAPAFLVPATVSCARIPGVFIDNRMCLININTFFIFNLKYVADLTFILRPFWLGTDLSGADWGRFDLESIWLEIEKSLCVKSYLLTIVQLKQLIRWLVLNPSFPFKSVFSLHCLYSLFFSLTILFLFRISVVWYVYLYLYRTWICYVLLYTCVSEFV